MKLTLVTKVFRSKTLAFAYLLTALGVLWDNVQLVREFLPPDTAGRGTAALGLIVLLLRALTSKPLSEK